VRNPTHAPRSGACCRRRNFEAARKELFAADAVGTEPKDTKMSPMEAKGLPAIIGKGHTFMPTNKHVHSITVSAPIVTDNVTACTMSLDVTMKGRGSVDDIRTVLLRCKERQDRLRTLPRAIP